MIDEWIEYLKIHPEDDWGDKTIDECDYEEEMNAVHVAVMRNKVQILKKLADAGAGMFSKLKPYKTLNGTKNLC